MLPYQAFPAIVNTPYDLTSTYFEGLAEENDLARRGDSRDHRSACKQVVPALIVTREGFPLAHLTLAGNIQDLRTDKTIVTTIETRFSKLRSLACGSGPCHLSPREVTIAISH